MLASLIEQHPLQEGDERRIRVLGCLESAPLGEKRAQPRNLHARGRELPGLSLVLGPTRGGIELDERGSRSDVLTVADVDRPDDAAFEGLDDFGMAARNELAPCDGDHVDTSQAGPENCGREDERDDPQDGTSRRRRR